MSNVCFECGAPAEHNHHVVPKVLGGNKTVPLCTKCHGLVHDRNFTRLKELQKKGIAKAKNDGVYKGRKIGTTKAKPAEIADLEKRGFSKSEIAKRLGIGVSSVYRLAKQEGVDE